VLEGLVGVRGLRVVRVIRHRKNKGNKLMRVVRVSMVIRIRGIMTGCRVARESHVRDAIEADLAVTPRLPPVVCEYATSLATQHSKQSTASRGQRAESRD
jgi:hypothetical protein